MLGLELVQGARKHTDGYLPAGNDEVGQLEAFVQKIFRYTQLDLLKKGRCHAKNMDLTDESPRSHTSRKVLANYNILASLVHCSWAEQSSSVAFSDAFSGIPNAGFRPPAAVYCRSAGFRPRRRPRRSRRLPKYQTPDRANPPPRFQSNPAA